jgi:hypothetical protein
MAQRGTYTRSNGDRYEGEFENDAMHGEGVYSWPNGDTYTGQFKNGKMNGNGTYRHVDGSIYVGEFSDDQKHGYGKLTTDAGEVAQQWQRGVKVLSGDSPARQER